MLALTVLLTLCIFSFGFTDSQVEEINSIAEKLSAGGVHDLKIIYDWGDGTTEEVKLKELGEESVSHFYENEGRYDVKTFLYGVKDGKAKTFAIESKQVNYKKEDIEYDVEMNTPDTLKQGEVGEFSALLKLTHPGIEIKNLKYQWFFDTETDQYYEGEKIKRSFNIPNSKTKPFYTVKLRVICKYRYISRKEMWLPLEVIREGRLRVKRTGKVRIIEYSKVLTTENGRITSPLFFNIQG